MTAKPVNRRARACIVVMLIASMPLSAPRAQNQATIDLGERLDVLQRNLIKSVEAAERVCLSSVSETERLSISGMFSKLVDGVKSLLGGNVQVERQVTRTLGAAKGLPKELMHIENGEIRNCMKPRVQPAMDFYAAQLSLLEMELGSTNRLIEFRFDFDRAASGDTANFTDNLVLSLSAPQSYKSSIHMQDPMAERFFGYPVSYPANGAQIRGVIIPERRPESVRSNAQAQITPFCLQRGALPSPTGPSHDHFSCGEGQGCKPAARSTGLLKLCTGRTAGAEPPALAVAGRAQTLGFDPARPALFRTIAYSADQPDSGSAAAAAAPSALAAVDHWSVPSIAALSAVDSEQPRAGYTIFYIDSDAFAGSDAHAVEMDLRVNGIPVYEDGLPPEYQPVPLDEEGRMSHSFALQTLNFVGDNAGCERIDIALTPLGEDGRRGDPLSARLSYVALRDMAPQSVSTSRGALEWTASYLRSAAKQTTMAFIKSFTYRDGDLADRDRAIAAAKADKAWLDSQNFTFKGQPVVGVLRPPRTVTNGRAAYGLMAGVEEENGSVRFVYEYSQARELLAQLVKARTTASARQVIMASAYPSDAGAGLFSPPRFCPSR